MIPYMAATRHLLNNQVLAIFSHSTAIPATQHYSGFENPHGLDTKNWDVTSGSL